MTHKPQGNKIEKRKNGGYEDVKEERIRRGIQSAGGQVSQKPWISKSSRGAANSCQHAVRLDTKGKNSRAGHRMRRTQPGRSIEHCQRKPATEKADQSIGKGKQTLKRNECVFGGCSGFFAASRQKSGKNKG